MLTVRSSSRKQAPLFRGNQEVRQVGNFWQKPRGCVVAGGNVSLFTTAEAEF